MTTTGAESAPRPTAAAGETPWYELISEVPEPPEDAMQQEDTILDVMSILKARYENVPGALWCSQSNIIYDSQTPGSVIAPDGMIVLGLNTDGKTIKRDRRIYRIDEWGVPPAFVLEVGSRSTAARDLGVKRDLYARIGVREYWRLDWAGESYPVPLEGERLVDGQYVRLRAAHRARRRSLVAQRGAGRGLLLPNRGRRLQHFQIAGQRHRRVAEYIMATRLPRERPPRRAIENSRQRMNAYESSSIGNEACSKLPNA